MAQIDSIPQGFVLDQPQVFEAGPLRATITAPQLLKADLLVLYMIRDAWPERPMYFSRTSGGYAQELGLQDHMLSQGLARKLVQTAIVPGRDTVAVQGEGYVDLPRSVALWNSFEGPKALIDRGDWVDEPSVGIPDLYTITGIMLAETLMRGGQPQQAQSVLATAEGIAKATRRASLFGFDRMRQQPQLPTGDNPLQGLVPGDTSAGAPPAGGAPAGPAPAPR
jgi:hypothetical protein